MPELPEVETIRRGLSGCLVRKKGGRILSVEVLETKSFIGVAEDVVGANVIEMRRRGKALIFDLSNKKSLICHLRMTGQMIWVGDERFAGGHPNDNFIDELPNKQTRVIIEFERGKLFFNDQRKFGFIKVVSTNEVEEDAFIRKLAKEPWEMTGEELYKKLQRHRGAPIKSTILDQTIIAGLGNIYADEALYFAKINPKRKAGLVSEKEAKTLIEGARVVMDRSLEAGGSTLRNYVKSDGTKGDYLELFAEVFNRQGQECRRCGEKIKKMKVGGRGTHYCPKCQKV
ncbi:bifunctional DNA-formamidopyrimidine glycosylase/DNA-(apurinic or apyrimidinic site) lyase [Candidatus Saccharibacteria bacterium]|nr:bifunctional DNA-formamidopyrimidine glycosylase/DNA-(apurinic or apyrimidinic site) lyase [Candidatus Saccharibacteria bacterium]